MFFFEKNPKNLQKPIEYTLSDGTADPVGTYLPIWRKILVFHFVFSSTLIYGYTNTLATLQYNMNFQIIFYIYTVQFHSAYRLYRIICVMQKISPCMWKLLGNFLREL